MYHHDVSQTKASKKAGLAQRVAAKTIYNVSTHSKENDVFVPVTSLQAALAERVWAKRPAPRPTASACQSEAYVENTASQAARLKRIALMVVAAVRVSVFAPKTTSAAQAQAVTEVPARALVCASQTKISSRAPHR